MNYFYEATNFLSPFLKEIVAKMDCEVCKKICEIRLRLDFALSFSTYSGSLFVDRDGKPCRAEKSVRVRAEDMRYAVNRLCAGSIYRYSDSMKKGYIVTPEGIRAGICGEAVYQNGKISVVDNFTAINLRIPRRIEKSALGILERYKREGLFSVLIFSAPGVGKTTLIREMALELCKSYRTAVVDEKGEILPKQMCHGIGMCDILRGYSKPEGMEIAVRTLSPQIIICDEIGMNDDIPAILSVQNSGVPLIATAHLCDFGSLALKPNIKKLCDAGVFEKFVRLEQGEKEMKLIFEGE